MRRSRKSRPTLRIDRSARSLYLDAHTPCTRRSQHKITMHRAELRLCELALVCSPFIATPQCYIDRTLHRGV